MSELTTKWPDRAQYETPGDPGPHDADCCLCVRCGRFYRDKSKAALERLRLAVDLLVDCRGVLEAIYGITPREQALHGRIVDGLDAIGTLPDLPPVQKEG